MKDLPTRVKLCDAFGYADDFKLVSTQPADIRTDLEATRQSWCEVNKMKLNENKCYVLPVKQQQNNEYHFELNSKFLERKFEQKDLGVIISAKLSWRANSLKRCKKASKAFYLKRNGSVLANTRTKLNAYVGYVIPVISYALMVWFVNKTECKEVESIQKKATAWILSSWEMNYKSRMAKLKLLPLSYYFELHDLLTLLTLLGGNYNINLPIKLNECAVRTRQNELIAIDKTRTKKADENFWIRSSKLLNIIIKSANIEIKQIDKQYLTKVYWNYFENCYSEVNSCSWTLLCNCGSCNTIQKVINSTPQ